MQSDTERSAKSTDQIDDLEVEVVLSLEDDSEPEEEIQLDRDEVLRDLRELQELSLRRAEGKSTKD